MWKMEFSDAYDAFIKSHVKRRTGADAQRIKDGLGHAETIFLTSVWWPAFRHFDGLHPEYKFFDFEGLIRYIDFAYVQPHFKIAIEIDGAGTHWRYITDEQFSDHCLRQDYLVIDGWHVLRFAYKDVQNRPRICQQIIQQLIGRLTSDTSEGLRQLHLFDRAIIQLAMGLNRPLTPGDVKRHTNMATNAAIRHLKSLVRMEWLEPASGTTRIRSYRLHSSRTNIRLQ